MVEQTGTLLVGHNGVLERGLVGIIGDGLDVVAGLLEGNLEGRQIIGGLDLAEVGGAEGYLTFNQQGILALGLAARKRHR